MTRLGKQARLAGVTILTLVSSSMGAAVTWGSSPPDSNVSAPRLKATVVNNHEHQVLARVSMNGTEWELGLVESGEQGTFRLPRSVKELTSFYLVADCEIGRRIDSDAIIASAGERPHFMVGQNSLTSYVRFLRMSLTRRGS